jgi:hypothetical protein
MKEDAGPVPDGIYKIDETTRHLGAPAPCDVQHVNQRCVAEGWTNWAGELPTPETVTLYDLSKYVIMPATNVHQCSYVELVTGVGEDERALSRRARADGAHQSVQRREHR